MTTAPTSTASSRCSSGRPVRARSRTWTSRGDRQPADQLLGGHRRQVPGDPDDHVDRGQSSNDTFPTAMHLATLLAIRGARCRRPPQIANDVRRLASGPRASLHELRLLVNEPSSSIMPSKADPTQQEAMVMVRLQVIGEDSIVAAGA